MALEPIEVSARWNANGWFSPRQFRWQGELYTVESTGRQWEDEDGLHVLCMVAGQGVFELVFRLKPAGWWVRLPRPGPTAA